MSPRKKTCTYCDYLTALTMHTECKKTQKNFWQARIAILQNKIIQAKTLRVLHLCGEDHRQLALDLRAKTKRLHAMEFIRRFEALRSAVRRYAEAEKRLAMAIQYSGTPTLLARLRWEVVHAKNLRAQRKRRLLELLPQHLTAQGVTTLADFFAQMRREASDPPNLTEGQRRA